MTTSEFLPVFNRLVVALREPQDESGMTAEIYFDALSDVPMDALQAGASALMRESGRKWFPTTAEWRTAATTAEAEQRRQRLELPSGRAEPWRYECDRCEDTGWMQGLTCDGGAPQWPDASLEIPIGKTKKALATAHYKDLPRLTDTPRAAACGRKDPHQPHDYTRPCPCRATNRTFQRHHDAGQAGR